jgi:NAD(P)-dependent dehydrogenase (short-subunit alcohol dehydrogenase family)
MKPVCLVVGAGAGIGAHIARKFASSGYHACFTRRTNQAGLDQLVDQIKRSGGDATGFLSNIAKENSIEKLVLEIEESIGPIEVVVYNIGAQIGDRSLKETSAKMFELGWRLGTFGLFRLASILLPLMEKRGSGNLLVTSATASMRGNAGQHSHASAMAGRRMLCQTLNAEYGTKGIHVCHIVIDGIVDAPDTVGLMLGSEKFEALRRERGMEKDGLLLPSAVAETYLHITRQHRSAWTHELDIRPFSELPWWNSEKPGL